jgi:RHS repeat-associated protein
VFDYDRAGRLIRDHGTRLTYDAYDQLVAVTPGVAGTTALVNLQITDLGAVAGGTYASAQDINLGGQIVGLAADSSNNPVGFYFPGSGSSLLLNGANAPGAVFTGLNAINSFGVATGYAFVNGQQHLLRFTPPSTFEDLGTQGTYTSGLGISNSGEIVGVFGISGGKRAFRYKDGFETLGDLGGNWSEAWDVTDDGVAVGASRLATTPTSPPGIATSGHAVLFDPVTNLPQDLNELVDEVMSPGWVLHVAVRKAGDYIYGTGTLDGVVRAYRMTLSSGIVIDPTFGALTATNGMTMSGNAYGDAVGTGRSEPNGPLKAWVYVEGIGLKILNDIVLSNSGWTLDSANAINDAGDVVGVGTHGGIRKPFRLRLPIRANGAPGPMLAEVHTYGFDGLRTSTTTFSPSNMMVPPKSQYWFTQDYTEREGKREHYVRIGDRIVAKVTMVPAPGGSGFVPVMDLRSKKLESGGGSGEPSTGLGVLLLALGLLGAAVASLKKRRGWVPSVAAVMALIFTATSCAMFGGDKVKSALWGPGTADDAPLYFHQGIAPGPTIITKSDGTVFEERRYEPFGHPIDAKRGGTQVSAVSFVADPQNILGKMTNPNTGWSYHGARWMTPQTARWSAPDPAIKGPSSTFLLSPWNINPYAYVSQKPTLLWDPDGRCGRQGSSGQCDEKQDTVQREESFENELGAGVREGTARGYSDPRWSLAYGLLKATGGRTTFDAVRSQVRDMYASKNVPGIRTVDTSKSYEIMVDGAMFLFAGLDLAFALREAASAAALDASAARSAFNDGVGAMRRLEFDGASYHGKVGNAVKSRGPTNGQSALDSSVRVKQTSTRRVGIDYDRGDFVVFDETRPGLFHGHVRPWTELEGPMQKALVDAGMANRRGKILIGGN